MTNKEMTELFAVMLLAWPNAEAFKGGMEKLAPTIKLWTSCTADVDFWTGRQAVIRLCRKSKFPPTIAEFREQTVEVDREFRALVERTFDEIRSKDRLCDSLDDLCRALPPGGFSRKVIDAMGGPEALVHNFEQGGKRYSMWNLNGIEHACRAVLQESTALEDRKFPALAGKSAGNPA